MAFNGTIADEREVVAACLDCLYLGENQVVRAMTRSGLRVPDDARMISYIRESLDGLESETLEDFLVKNRERHPVEPDFDPDGRLICVGDEEFRSIFWDGDGWERFREAYPDSDGTLRFSRVGFDRGLTQAMLYAGQQFDWSLGSGGHWLFSKAGDEWVEAGRLGKWIS